jgi:hypothetical protein
MQCRHTLVIVLGEPEVNQSRLMRTNIRPRCLDAFGARVMMRSTTYLAAAYTTPPTSTSDGGNGAIEAEPSLEDPTACMAY